jgi:hypothetical protein
MTDIEILETVVGGQVIKEMSALSFMGWLANKLNNVTITNDPNLAELRVAIANPPIMPRLADESKIKYVRKLLALGIAL